MIVMYVNGCYLIKGVNLFYIDLEGRVKIYGLKF